MAQAYTVPNPKGGILLPATGYIQVHAFAGLAMIPLENVAITVTDNNNQLIALRLTDSSGRIVPIAVTVPDRAASQTPDTGEIPFSTVRIFARLENYSQISVDNVQVFAGTVTDQNLTMIPLSELPGDWNQGESFNTPPQNL